MGQMWIAYRLQPFSCPRNTLLVQEEAREQQTEQHHKVTDQVRHSSVTEYNPDEQEDCSGGQVEQCEEENEFPELGPLREETGHRINNDAKWRISSELLVHKCWRERKVATINYAARNFLFFLTSGVATNYLWETPPFTLMG